MDHTMRRAMLFALGTCLACACSEETSPDGSPGGSGGAAGSGMVAGSGGAAGSGMLPNAGTGGAAMPMPDAGSIGGSSGAAGSGSNPNCPTIAPRPIPGQTIAIVAVNVPGRVIYFQNVSNADIELTNPDWQWCALPAYAPLVPEDVTLAPGEIGQVAGLAGFEGSVEGGEMAIYDEADFNQEESMRAFLIWNDPITTGRESVAAQGGVWTFRDRATIEPGDVGLYATGLTDEAAGYTSVPASCFPLPR
jgi:hypothetical protein